MASKTLVRTGASLVSRFLSNPFLRQSPNPNPNQRIVSQGLDIAPKLFPSLSKFENSLHLPQYQNDAESIRKVASEGFVYPSGLPSLSFYLPEGTLSLSVYMCVCVCENHLFGFWENEVRRWEIRNLWTFKLWIFYVYMYVCLLALFDAWENGWMDGLDVCYGRFGLWENWQEILKNYEFWA